MLGAGAAGLMCAIEAGRRGRRVLLLDHAERVGKKILISGGGRCNFTNLHCTPQNFLSGNPHFAKSALARYTAADFIMMVEDHRIPYHEKTLGQLFCDRTSRDIVAMLERECAAANVRVQLETRVLKVDRREAYVLETASPVGEEQLRASSLVVATGGLSIPKMGATGFGYELARQFRLQVVPCRPALVPFTFMDRDQQTWCDLSGVSTEVVATVAPRTPPAKRPGQRKASPAFREKLLITHRGVSGPATLQMSSYWAAGDLVSFDLAPDRKIFAPLLVRDGRRDRTAALTAVRTVLPTRWAERWLANELLSESRELSNQEISQLEEHLHAWELIPSGTEGYGKAEVTAGGVDTAELDAKTMQSRKVPGLYFIGEVVDVTGWLGGFNFQWAWASGFSAGQAV